MKMVEVGKITLKEAGEKKGSWRTLSQKNHHTNQPNSKAQISFFDMGVINQIMTCSVKDNLARL